VAHFHFVPQEFNWPDKFALIRLKLNLDAQYPTSASICRLTVSISAAYIPGTFWSRFGFLVARSLVFGPGVFPLAFGPEVTGRK
jgi:hypothetical protein